MSVPFKVHHVTATLQDTGGPSYTVPALCRALGERGLDVSIHVLEPCPSFDAAPFRAVGYPVSPGLRWIGGSRELKRGLKAAARDAQVMHGHSLWRMPNVYPLWAVKGTACRLVVSPRGMLDAWAFRYRAFRKWPFWYALQRACLAHAACIHATAEQEYRFIRDLGLDPPVMLVPNGVDIPDLASERPTTQHRRLLFLARIHPKKGVDLLLRAWREVQAGFPDWELRVVGPDNEGYLATMRELARASGCERVTLTGYVSEERKATEYREAQLYILPTHTENWGVTVADALAYGVPAIVGRGAPWSELPSRDCGWWIPVSVESIADCLRQALARPPARLLEMGSNGRAWVASAFAWSRVADQTIEAYQWLVNGGRPPDCVRLD